MVRLRRSLARGRPRAGLSAAAVLLGATGLLAGLLVGLLSSTLAPALAVGPTGTPVSAVTAADISAGIVPPRQPPRSISPDPDFYEGACGSLPSDVTPCNTAILKAIAAARRAEGLGPFHVRLAVFERLTAAEQLFVAADLERTARGLPPIEGLTRQLDHAALAAAEQSADPSIRFPYRLLGGGTAVSFGSNWAGGTFDALGSTYGWMYDDGLHSPNGDCRTAAGPGCWGHRDNILGDDQRDSWADRSYCPSGRVHLVMGAASAEPPGAEYLPSQTQLFVEGCGRAPAEYFTWSEAHRLLYGS